MPYADGNPTLTEQIEEDERRKFYTDDLLKEAREDREEIRALKKALAEYLDWHESNFMLPSGNFEDPDQDALAKRARELLGVW